MSIDAANADVGQVRLRDKRKPGHCWQDNELYDCFQPVIGPLAVGVYVRITRECYGAALKISLRELAALTGISKSAVSRAMAVLELVGLVIAKRGSAQRSPEYDLADLKELAIAAGAVFDAKRSSYVLPREKRETLRREVVELEKRLHRRSVPVGDTAEQGAGDTGVPGGGQSCPPKAGKKRRQQISKKGRSKYNNNTPLPPSHATGELCVDAAADRVMQAGGFSNRRLKPVILRALQQHVASFDVGADETAALMISNWAQYCRDGPLLRFTWSPRKFFDDGHWRNWELWPIDRARLDRMQNASVGAR